jgi:hypothetical protein
MTITKLENPYLAELEAMEERHRDEASAFLVSLPLKAGDVIGWANMYLMRLKHIEAFDIVRQGFFVPLSEKDIAKVEKLLAEANPGDVTPIRPPRDD